MYNLDTELKSCVQSVANRLRMIQIDLANENSNVQNEHLREEIDRAIKSIAPEKRTVFLTYLRTYFSGNLEASSKIPSKTQPSEPSSSVAEALDNDVVVEILIKRFSTLSDAQKQALVRCFDSNNCLPRQGSQQVLGSNRHDVDIDRVMQTFSVLMDFFSTLEPLVNRIWFGFLRQNNIRTPQRIKTAIESYTSLQSNDITIVKNEVSQFQRLITAILASVSIVGKQIAFKFQSSLSPQSIEAAVKLEGGNLLEGNSSRCWKKYKILSANWTEEMIANDVQKIIAENVDRLLKQS